MKYPTHIYAKALAEVVADSKRESEKDSAKIVKNFLELVRRNGDEAHLRKILEEAARFTRGKSGMRKMTVASARKLSASQEKSIEKLIRKDDVVERVIDPELVAGVRIVLNDELQFDGSLRGKLDKLFRNSN